MDEWIMMMLKPLGGHGVPKWPREGRGTLEGAQPKGTTTRAKRYAHNGLEDKRL